MASITTLKHLGELIEISEVVYGEEKITADYIEGLKHAALTVLNDSRDSFVTFYGADGNYEMHVTSTKGGREVIKLMALSLDYMFRHMDAEEIKGQVQARKFRLLIGMSSGLVPSGITRNGDDLYVITKDNLKEIQSCLKWR